MNIVDPAGVLLESIDFTRGLPIARTDAESAFFAQDQWTLSSKFALNFGVRVEQQEVTEAWRVGPRAGLVIQPVQERPDHLQSWYGHFLRPRSPQRLWLRFLPRTDHHDLESRWHDRERSLPIFQSDRSRGSPPLAVDLPGKRRSGQLLALQHQFEFSGGADFELAPAFSR